MSLILFTSISVTSSGFFASHATAAKHRITFPVVDANEETKDIWKERELIGVSVDSWLWTFFAWQRLLGVQIRNLPCSEFSFPFFFLEGKCRFRERGVRPFRARWKQLLEVGSVSTKGTKSVRVCVRASICVTKEIVSRQERNEPQHTCKKSPIFEWLISARRF